MSWHLLLLVVCSQAVPFFPQPRSPGVDCSDTLLKEYSTVADLILISSSPSALCQTWSKYLPELKACVPNSKAVDGKCASQNQDVDCSAPIDEEYSTVADLILKSSSPSELCQHWSEYLPALKACVPASNDVDGKCASQNQDVDCSAPLLKEYTTVADLILTSSSPTALCQTWSRLPAQKACVPVSNDVAEKCASGTSNPFSPTTDPTRGPRTEQISTTETPFPVSPSVPIDCEQKVAEFKEDTKHLYEALTFSKYPYDQALSQSQMCERLNLEWELRRALNIVRQYCSAEEAARQRQLVIQARNTHNCDQFGRVNLRR